MPIMYHHATDETDEALFWTLWHGDYDKEFLRAERQSLSPSEFAFVCDEAATFHDELSGTSDPPTPEDFIYSYLLCCQISLAEARGEALATVFDALHSAMSPPIAHEVSCRGLMEPQADVLRMFTPTDLCNYTPAIGQTAAARAVGSDGLAFHGGDSRALQKQPTVDRCYGVSEVPLSVARNYITWYGNRARTFVDRADLESDIYKHMAIVNSADQAYIRDTNIQFPAMREIIFAIAHGLKLVRVRKGRKLEWNRYRDNYGNKLR